MNYYNPYYLVNPVNMNGVSSVGGLFGRSGLTFSSILNGAQKALGLFNQALPLIKEAAPMMRNARTMFRVMNEFKKLDAPSNNSNSINTDVQDKSYNKINESTHSGAYSNGGPTFFI